MSTAGSREEMLEALQKARLAMARRAPGAMEPGAPQPRDADDCGADAPRAPPAPSAARDNRGHFFDTWCRKIELFVADPTKTVLELPPDLPANDRRELHTLAEKYNLSHQSRGVGASRQLILRKDALHYRMPDARPEDMDLLRQQPRGGEKQSKFHLRRTRADPDAAIGSIGAFGDGETAQMVRRLDRATDEYRRAVEIGYTQDELLAVEAGETVEATLRRPRPDAAVPNGPQAAEEKEQQKEKEEEEEQQKRKKMRMEQERPQQPKVAAVYDEVCLRCGASARVEYDVRKWECNGHCVVCARQTVWKLVEAEEDLKGGGGGDAAQKQKQQQQQQQRLSTSAAPEEIDKNNEEDDTVTVEDVVDMASMNDFCAADVNWVRRFATHHQPHGSRRALNEHIVFCIDFADLPGMRIFREEHVGTEEEHSAAKRARLEEAEEWFLRLREVRDAGTPLSALLEEVATGRYDAVAVAFPNMSVYGSGAVCICRVRVPQGGGDAAWAALQRKYGEKHVQFSRVLDDVLSDETEIA